MNIDIWSDVRCPFCYIGKHKFEQALNEFPNKEKIHVRWRSFELDPYLETNPDISPSRHLAENKGMSVAQVEQMSGHIRSVAEKIGLEMKMERSIVANSFHAHRLIQYAQSKGLGQQAEEQFLRLISLMAKI